MAVPFESHTNLLFYDVTARKAEVWRYVDRGQMVHLKALLNLPGSWTRIVSGHFGGVPGGLLMYDAHAGQGRVYRMNGDGGDLTLVKHHGNFAKTWTHIVEVPFGLRTDLLFYASGVGAAEIYRFDAQGEMEQLSRYLDFATSWSHIVPVSHFTVGSDALAYFYDPTGKVAAYRIDGLGQMKLFEHRTDLAQNWTRIVPVREDLPVPVYRIRMRAIVTGNNNGPTFSAGFKKTDITNIVAFVNAVYREAGVHIDFDPDEDVEEIKSTLLNRDFGLDTNNEQTLYPVNALAKNQSCPSPSDPKNCPSTRIGQA